MYYLPFSHLYRFWKRMQEGGKKSFTYEEVDKSWRILSVRDMFVHYLEPLNRDLESRDEL